MNFMKFFCMAVCIWGCFSAEAHQETSNEVLFVSPSLPEDPFFRHVDRLARVAASQLNLQLAIIHGDGNRLLQQQKLQEYLQKHQPRYAIVQAYSGAGPRLMDLLAKYPIKIITLESLWHLKDRQQVGRALEKYPNWLAELSFDNQTASLQLTEHLIQSCTSDQKIPEVIGLNGSFGVESEERLLGLSRGIGGKAQLQQVVNAEWLREQATEQTQHLLRRYPNSRVIWTASDWMALGALDALSPSQRSQFCVGGFDWLPEAVQSIENGQLTASVGGHFLMAAWALVLIYDHQHGHLPKKLPENMLTLEVLHRGNISKYQSLLEPRNWTLIDFRQFSFTHQPQQQHYRFNLQEVAIQLEQQRKQHFE